MTSRKLIELQRQKEIVEQWLQIPGIPSDARARLLEMLGKVNAEMNMDKFLTHQGSHAARRLAT